jgi:hypothetical protein
MLSVDDDDGNIATLSYKSKIYSSNLTFYINLLMNSSDFAVLLHNQFQVYLQSNGVPINIYSSVYMQETSQELINNFDEIWEFYKNCPAISVTKFGSDDFFT